MPEFPDVCPEGALVVTQPFTGFDLDFNAGLITLRFNEGESLDIPLKDLDSLPILTLALSIARHVFANNLVWADPALIAEHLAARGV